MSTSYLISAGLIVATVLALTMNFSAGWLYGCDLRDAHQYVAGGLFGFVAFAMFWIPSCMMAILLLYRRLRVFAVDWRYLVVRGGGALVLSSICGFALGAVCHKMFGPPPF